MGNMGKWGNGEHGEHGEMGNMGKWGKGNMGNMAKEGKWGTRRKGGVGRSPNAAAPPLAWTAGYLDVAHTKTHARTHPRTPHTHTRAHAHARTRAHARTHTLTHARTHTATSDKCGLRPTTLKPLQKAEARAPVGPDRNGLRQSPLPSSFEVAFICYHVVNPLRYSSTPASDGQDVTLVA
eukprot:366157-Chlamydomonas_euryale.AAC.1